MLNSFFSTSKINQVFFCCTAKHISDGNRGKHLCCTFSLTLSSDETWRILERSSAQFRDNLLFSMCVTFAHTIYWVKSPLSSRALLFELNIHHGKSARQINNVRESAAFYLINYRLFYAAVRLSCSWKNGSFKVSCEPIVSPLCVCHRLSYKSRSLLRLIDTLISW